MRVANLDMTQPNLPRRIEIGKQDRATTVYLWLSGRTRSSMHFHYIFNLWSGVFKSLWSNPCISTQFTRCFSCIFLQQIFIQFYVECQTIIITHGQSPRQHIWTLANATRPDLHYTGVVPPFIGQDYFCETGSRQAFRHDTFYPDDPLWDGQGCGGTSTCCEFNNPPWLCKQLPQPTTDDIELRLCGDKNITHLLRCTSCIHQSTEHI